MNAIAPLQQTGTALTFGEMERLGGCIARSKLFGIQTPEQALVLMAISQAEGRHPALAARDYDIIQGKPAKKAEAMMRDFMSAGGKIEWHKLDDTEADATFSHPQGGKVRISWTMERAKAAGLAGKDMWKKFPRQMLRSRTVSEGVRTVFPMATSGMYVPEEMADTEQPRREPPHAGPTIEARAEPVPASQVLNDSIPALDEAPQPDGPAFVARVRNSLSRCANAEAVLAMGDHPAFRAEMAQHTAETQEQARALLADAYARFQPSTDLPEQEGMEV